MGGAIDGGKTMNIERLAAQILELPPQERRRVQKLVNEIRRGAAHAKPPGSVHRRSLAKAPFLGMWKDRPEMKDSTAWVRTLRQREWGGRK